MAFNDQRNLTSLLARELYFRDKSNRPISTNRALLARGDGGTYWADTTISTQTAFNNFRASTIEYAASNVSNTIWLEPGNGIEFYSTIQGGVPITWITATGPDTLNVPGSGSIDLNNLPDNSTLGRTLTFEGTGDVSIYVSGATVTFNANNASSFSSITGLQEVTEQLQSTTQGLENEVQDILSTVNIFFLSTSVSTFYSTLIYTKNLAESLSTFTYSTFNIENNTLNITYPTVHISSLIVDQFDGPFRSTFSTIYWSTAYGINTNTSNARISTIIGDSSPLVNFDASNNRIGINLGMTPPRTTVDVGGIVFATAFVNASDRRLKTALEPLPAKVPDAYRFTWIRDGTTDVGCMADEVEEMAPECVIEGADGFKAVNYAKLVPYCVATIKDLQARIAALEARV